MSIKVPMAGQWLHIRGALVFIIFIPTKFATYLQLLGGIWIIQTLPAVMLGVYTSWFNDWALLLGWAVRTIAGTAMAVAVNLTPTYPLALGGTVGALLNPFVRS
jgi:SSS family solute:Na+ symporter